MVICTNCKGKGGFKDVKCFCASGREHAVPDCQNCHGAGVHDTVCICCDGDGEFPEVYGIRFYYEDKSFDFDVRQSLPIAYKDHRMTNDGYDNDNSRPVEDIVSRCFTASLDEHEIYQQLSEAVGLDLELAVVDNPIASDLAWVLNFPAVSAFEGDTDYAKGMGTAASEEVVRTRLYESLVRSLAARGHKHQTVDDLIPIEVFQRLPLSDIIEELQTILAPHDCGFRLSVHEGNIATGESGWEVYAVAWPTPESEGVLFCALALSYTPESALHAALGEVKSERFQECLDKYRASYNS